MTWSSFLWLVHMPATAWASACLKRSTTFACCRKWSTSAAHCAATDAFTTRILPVDAAATYETER
jgi:hypothetical protein